MYVYCYQYIYYGIVYDWNIFVAVNMGCFRKSINCRLCFPDNIYKICTTILNKNDCYLNYLKFRINIRLIIYYLYFVICLKFEPLLHINIYKLFVEYL